MDDKTYRRMFTPKESHRGRVNRLNGIIVGSCDGCGAGFSTKADMYRHGCDKTPRWEVSYERVPTIKKTGYQVHRAVYETRAPNEAVASKHFWQTHTGKHSSYIVTKIERTDAHASA